jgi:hypothetical protein
MATPVKRVSSRTRPVYPRRSAGNWWRCLDKSPTPHAVAAAQANCGNCGSALTGPFCAQCGQHAHESARSVAALFHDAWHLATHVDDRLWKTLYTLLLHPGVLTKEYFAEHRARYLPPVRVYLVLSVLFFAFGSSSPHNMAGNFKGVRAAASTASAGVDDDDNGVADSDDAPKIHGGWASLFTKKNCGQLNSDIKWLEKPLQQSCYRNAETHGETIKNAFIGNVPKMMFLFVPLMALAMMLLYWWPRHYYVEHLVLFLHNHAAVFLILLVETLFASIAGLFGWTAVGRWVVALTSIYAIWYVYRAMRVYYEQGRSLTLFKLGVVGFTYLIGFSLTLLMTLIVSIIFS